MKLYASLIAACLLLPASLMAQSEIKVIDQNGNPVSEAVISLPGTEVSVSEQTLVMDQVNKQFLPQVLLIQQGQSVHFPNSDNIRHHVYSFSSAKPFEIKLYSGSSTDPVRFDKSGLVVLGCNIHDNMIGYIYVADNELAQISNNKGLVTFNQDLLPKNVQVWHAKLSNSSSKRKLFVLEKKNTEGDWLLQINLIAKPKSAEKKVKSFRNRFN